MLMASPRRICMGVTLTVLVPFMTTNLWSAPAEPPVMTEHVKLDEGIKPYAKVSGVSGTINSIGSLNPFMPIFICMPGKNFCWAGAES